MADGALGTWRGVETIAPPDLAPAANPAANPTELRRIAGPSTPGRRRLGRSRPLAQGDWVQVKSLAEIAATLDVDGKLDGLPFMPEMARYAGRRLRVHRRAEKTCVEGGGLRRLEGVVLLQGARCDGAWHGGCERGCLSFWKEAWLAPAPGPDRRAAWRPQDEPALARLLALPVRRDDRWLCQSTALLAATRPIPTRDLRHLFDDLRRGELTWARLFEIAARTAVNRVRKALGLPDLGQLTGAAVKPAKGELALQPGEAVRVKPRRALIDTLDCKGTNGGLTFEPEMADYAGQVFEVERPVRRIIHEETGRMVTLSRTVALKGVHCQGRCVKNCPRANPLYWREAWLERA